MKLVSAIVALAVGGAIAGGCGRSQEASEGETHFLRECDSDTDCDRGTCLCHVCTITCDGDRDCAGRPNAACYETRSPALAPFCSSTSGAGEAVCLASCEDDDDCPGRMRCHLGACIPLPDALFDASMPEEAGPAEARPAEAGAIEAGPKNQCGGDDDCPGGAICSQGRCTAFEDAGTRPRPREFLPRDAGTDVVRQPVSLPPPETEFEGDAAALVGTWLSVLSNGEVCTPATAEEIVNGTCCPKMIVEETPEGKIEATMTFQAYAGSDFPKGPFAPATDPDLGYPEEISIDYYANELPFAEVPYRLFDPIFDGTRFTFFTSATEIWSDWCALQTPYLHQGTAELAYRCVADSADESNTDPKKLWLCTSALDGEMKESSTRSSTRICAANG